MFSCVTLEQRVPQHHPLREIRKLADVVFRSLSDEFDALYSASGRPSIAPEYVLRALLLQVFYSVRSERQLVEQLDYNLLWQTHKAYLSRRLQLRKRQVQPQHPAVHAWCAAGGYTADGGPT